MNYKKSNEQYSNQSNDHKTQQNHRHSTVQPEKLTKQKIQERVDHAFKDAFNLLLPLDIKQVLKKSNTVIMKQVRRHIRSHFNESSKKNQFFKISITNDEQNQQNEVNFDDDDSDIENGIEDDNNVSLLPHTTNSRLQAMKRVCNTINYHFKHLDFLVNQLSMGKRNTLIKILQFGI